MGKFGWSHPPGVTGSMLPGNSEENQAAEAMADAVYDAASKAGLDTDDPLLDDMVVLVMKLLNEAYAAGYEDGTCDERFAQDYRRQKEEEERGPVGDGEREESANDRLASEKYKD